MVINHRDEIGEELLDQVREAKSISLPEDHNSTNIWLHYEPKFQLFE
jgi:hypothetical protein